MPLYFICEIRSADEVIATNKNLMINMNRLVESDQSTTLAKDKVHDIEEVINRIMVFFMMATFLSQCSFEHAFDYPLLTVGHGHGRRAMKGCSSPIAWNVSELRKEQLQVRSIVAV